MPAPTPPKKSGWILLLKIVVGVAMFVVIFTVIEQHEINKERLRPRFAPAVVKTHMSITLKPGERHVFSTADPVTGQLCRYVAKWEKYTQDSTLRHTIHNFLGKDGVGGRKGSSHLTPSRNNNFLHGDDENTDIAFVCVENDGPDPVTFSVDLIGYRQVYPPVALEK